MNNQMPTGTVTLMFTDIEGHTKMWEQMGDDFMPILEAHNAILRSAAAKCNGYEVKTEGDAFMLAFARASDAVLCAVETQVTLANHPWPEDVGKIRVRIGIHTGEPQVAEDDYFGPPVIRASRISAAGHGGQILISAVTRELVLEELPEALEFTDLGLHRLKDLGRAERIFQVNHPFLPQSFPPIRTLDIIPNNLPIQLTSFVGRETEIRKIAELLGREQMRLVTLTGPGGIGKTRLSLQVAAEQLEYFPDGVWFINLAPLTDSEQVITEIASVLSIQLQPTEDLKKQVMNYLFQKRLLLVFDNFEHLTEAASLVNDLLRGTESLHCLVTSRELLQLPGEQTFAVPPLSTPSEDTEVKLLSQYESVRLFIERAQTVKPDFELTPQNAAAIAGICHSLAGISLAIELAAARVRGITVGQILERLSRQFEFLSTRSRAVPERHRTLRAAIDWSYTLLDPDEQKLFAQLSVFSGGLFLEAAEEICDVLDVFELIFNLQDKSLLKTEEVMEQTRYRLLEPLRAYAQEKLLEPTALQSAHAAYYLSVAQELDQKLQGVEQSIALSLIALDLDNFRAAMAFAQEHEEWKLLGQLSVALSRFFYVRGFWSEQMQCLRQAEAALRRIKDNALLAKTLHGLGRLYTYRGDLATAQNLHAESLQIRKDLGDKQGIARSLRSLGIIAGHQGGYEEAKQFFIESLEIQRELGNKHDIASSLNNLGLIAERQGAYEESKQLLTESLKYARELGNKQLIAGSLVNLGVIALNQEAYDEARPLFTESLEIFRELGDKRGIASSLSNLGLIAMNQGDYDEAKPLLTESLKIERELGNKQGIVESLRQLGEFSRSEGNSTQAVLFFLASIRLYDEMKAANSRDAMEVGKALTEIQNEIGAEQFERLKGKAETMSVEQVIDLALD